MLRIECILSKASAWINKRFLIPFCSAKLRSGYQEKYHASYKYCYNLLVFLSYLEGCNLPKDPCLRLCSEPTRFLTVYPLSRTSLEASSKSV